MDHDKTSGLAKELAAHNSQLRAQLADYENMQAEHRRLVRELDVLLNGEEGAAKQASLVDIVVQLRRDNPAAHYRWLRDEAMSFDQVGTSSPYVVRGQTMQPLEGAALDNAVRAARAASFVNGREG